MLEHFHKPRPLAWFFFIAAFATTVGLGTWQVKRLEWKQGLIAAIESGRSQPPLTALPSDPAELEARNFTPVEVRGRWLDQEFHIYPRFFRGHRGYFVVTPLALEDGRTLLVNRGWVPEALKKPESRPDSQVRGSGVVDGLLRVGADRNGLTPPNSPDENIWFGRDAEEMGAYGKLPQIIPAMVDLVGEQDPARLPVPSDGEIKLRNDHLSYIITWYGIALGVLVIFLLYHRKK